MEIFLGPSAAAAVRVSGAFDAVPAAPGLALRENGEKMLGAELAL